MKRTKFTESQIVSCIKQYESRVKVDQICREMGIHKATFYNWKKRYSGMDSLELKRLKELEEENRKLKQMYADMALDNKMLKDVLLKKW
ncbi:transposase [Flagellimonas lutimaris]|uniref:Transposase n=1 Tax=Flagellimonas lutimaris TaxID=475082 RepID=A0A3A1N5D7_9FLAO|nr:transposase [Allomuricauda lutimaris]RIV31645.1 transposase [Allomuricauda lutimaris]